MHFGNITDIKGVSQVFWDFKCLSTLEIPLVLKRIENLWYIAVIVCYAGGFDPEIRRNRFIYTQIAIYDTDLPERLLLPREHGDHTRIEAAESETVPRPFCALEPFEAVEATEIVSPCVASLTCFPFDGDTALKVVSVERAT